ncbi:MAG: proline--tRNA ligase [Spirochaetia bacterium]|nr:proline--tRNA ligase [Spirochaetia bacterium]
MRLSKYFLTTFKEAPKEAEVISHILMIRAGMIQKLAAGIYNYLPLAQRSIAKIEKIIREELDKRGLQECLMPAVQPAELWQESGRWGYYGPELLRFKDRKNADYCLGPTHEEVITDMVRRNLKSYRQLPWNIYQIQTKFRDEVRPRFGLMRGREFIMKDAYSFDVDEEASIKSYYLMYDAYTAIFKRCGLKFKAVDASTGAIGGELSHEFQVLADSGEDTILSCSKCDYAANVEKAVSDRVLAAPDRSNLETMKEVSTPGQKTIEEISAFLGKGPEHFIKTLIYMVDDAPVAVLVPGEQDANEAKIQGALHANSVVPADEETVKRVTGAEVGFAGPVGLKEKIKIVADKQIYGRVNLICGANKTDFHLTGIDPERDFKADLVADITFAKVGEKCPHCDGVLEQYRGIEVGQVFHLGTKYSKPMHCIFLDKNGKESTAVMGCYGIGVTRTLAAFIEQNHDDKGIIWSPAVAPFEVEVIPLQSNNEKVCSVAEDIYNKLGDLGIDVIIDDRDERAGFKMNDADLIGFPVQVQVGARSVENGQLEIKARRTGEKVLVDIDKAVSYVQELLKTL